MLALLRRARAADPRLFTVRAVLLAAAVSLGLSLALFDDPLHDGLVRGIADPARHVRPMDLARAFGIEAGVAGLLLCAALAASARRWLGPAQVAPLPALAAPRAPAWLAPVVAAAVACSGFLAWPRLSLSLWDDEEIALGCCVDGAYERDERNGELHFRDVSLRDVWFASHEGHNHVPQSLLSHLALDTWRAIERPPHRMVSERALRLPSWLAGMGSVALVAVFARRLGLGAIAAAGAAWLLAVHPWHVRYTSEARAYALLFLLLPASWILLLAALERGSWRAWLAHAGVQAALVWAHPSMVWQVGVTGAAALVALVTLRRGTARREQLARWGIAHLAAGLAAVPLVLPHLVQILPYLAEFRGEVRFDARLLDATLAHLFSGAPWRSKDPAHYAELADVAASSPLLFRTAVGLALAALGAGSLRLLFGGALRAALLPALLLPAPLLYAVSWLRADRFFEWYVVFALPGLALVVAAGLGVPALALRSARARNALAALCTAGFVALFAITTHPLLAALRSHSIVPLRESVLLTRPTLDPFAPENERIVTVSFQRPAYYYDPRFVWLNTPEALEAQLAAADAAGQTLYVNIRYGLATRRLPELVRSVEDPARFETVGVLHGYIQGNERRVYRYRGRAAAAGRPETLE